MELASMASSGKRKQSNKLPTFIRNVVPDRLDLRDRAYQPAVQVIPKPAMQPIYNLPVLYQGDCNGCTGFSLATVVQHLLHASGRDKSEIRVMPYMLNSMARCYDDFPGYPDGNTGSSLCGVIKGTKINGRADCFS